MTNRFSDMALNMGVGKDKASAAAAENSETALRAVMAPDPAQIVVSKESGASEPEPGKKNPMTRKTTAMPLLLDWAIKELKERRNLSRQIKGEKRKLTEDDIVVEALEYFFSKENEAADCYVAVTTKMKSVI